MPATSTVPPDVAAFVTRAAGLTSAVLDEIRDVTTVAVASGTYDHSVVPALSASQFSALDEHVREAFAPRAEELRGARPGGLRAAISRTTLAAQAIWKRDTSTADQYISFLDAFAVREVTLSGRHLQPAGTAGGDEAVPDRLVRRRVCMPGRLQVRGGGCLQAGLGSGCPSCLVEVGDEFVAGLVLVCVPRGLAGTAAP